jgi:hypothetical protein
MDRHALLILKGKKWDLNSNSMGIHGVLVDVTAMDSNF